jgi:hypothetical protein
MSDCKRFPCECCERLEAKAASYDALKAENERLRQRVLTAAGDDLCRLSQEEIKELTSGKVPIPPKEEFLASCEQFHSQIAKEAGVNGNCLTLAQMVAENERLRESIDGMMQHLQAEVAHVSFERDLLREQLAQPISRDHENGLLPVFEEMRRLLSAFGSRTGPLPPIEQIDAALERANAIAPERAKNPEQS